MALLRGHPDNMSPGIYNNCEEIYGVIYTAYSAVQTFAQPVKELVIQLRSHSGEIVLSPDGINWSDVIYLPGYCTMVVPFETLAFKIRSMITSGWCHYVVTGYFQE